MTRWEAEAPGSWRYVVVLNGTPLRLALAAGPGWVKVTVPSRNGVVKPVEHLEQLPSRILLGWVAVMRRQQGPCPVVELADRRERERAARQARAA